MTRHAAAGGGSRAGRTVRRLGQRLGRRPWLGFRRLALQRRDRVAALVLVLALVAAAVVVLATREGGHRVTARPPTPPSPNASTTAPSASSVPSSRAASAKAAAPFHCSTHHPRSGGTQPVALCIPSLRVDTTVMSLGLNPDRTVQVPPLSQVGEAGWYRYSAAPGAVGPTVILGHIDSAQFGEGVFYRLGRLRAGSQVQLWRDDGKLATFRINSVVEVPKTRFPTDAVYGATSGPAIRLVTCGGRFDSATGNYLDNIIAYGTLLDLRAA